ncbi:hypothetical protein [Salipiger aestuarii]|uniref:Secreted protein n=1 Tax=Salipiger aestuarii TaxID=568098 RepID=A0A327YW50_9RHOB|nr:hypothetical protein [Salipiger aestuarii]EIE51167.1 hypothetical protein C357_10122 [Citreicella sp. 357]KAA8615999.1 hypothetical protein AL037_01860 [Salipiger aestuarii]KAB2543391.1 hypothetical protein AL035_02755 [Salipiger aestuarii]RAK23935.1 hypothetical protein ATI53_100142 [Salipiger aestuarii]
MTIKSVLGLATAGLLALAPIAQAQEVKPRDPLISSQQGEASSPLVPALIGGGLLLIVGLAAGGGDGGGGGSSNNTVPD